MQACAGSAALPLLVLLPPLPSAPLPSAPLPPHSPPRRAAPPQEIAREQLPCADQAKAFADCMGWSNGDMGACQDYFDKMQACRRALQ